MIQLLILADDLTGALDASVPLAARGAKVRVTTRFSPEAALEDPETEVLVAAAETRHLPASAAYETVRHIAAAARRLGIPSLYKKTDSALRGNIGAELTALLDGTGEPALAFLPAFPQMGRCTVGGIHYIHGVPVADSVFGQDPFNPVLHSQVAQRIREQSQAPTHHASAQAPWMGKEGITIFDASCQEDLEQAGAFLQKKHRLHVSAGCAGFGAVLAELLFPEPRLPAPLPRLPRRLLTVCGSLHPATAAQLDQAEQAGFARRRLTPEQKLDPAGWQAGPGARQAHCLLRWIQENPFAIVDSSDPEGASETAAYARKLLAGSGDTPLFVIGGDTLLQCMDALEVYEMEPLRELLPGVVLSRFSFQGSLRYLISKSGGFGKPSLFLELREILFPHTAPAKEVSYGIS